MRPHSLEIIQGIQNSLMTHVMPELRSSFAQAQLMYITMLLNVVAKYWDGGVQALVDDNRRMREIFGQAAEVLASLAGAQPAGDIDALAADLRVGARERPCSLTMTDLMQENNRLRALLARLAPLCERAEADPALAALRPLHQKLVHHMGEEARQRVVPVLGS